MNKKINTNDDEKMEMEEFLKLDKPTIDVFLKLDEEAVEYDFSNDVANDNYRKLNDMYKFFAYMMVSKKDNFIEEISSKKDFKIKNFKGNDNFKKFYENAAKLVKKDVSNYGDIIDPDSESQLLQEIYKILWNVEDKNLKEIEECMQKCIINKRKPLVIQGETLNSVNTTLNELYKFFEEEFKEEQQKPIDKSKQRVSITFILSMYLNDEKKESKIMKKILENENLISFVNSYHTIGNFMPIPKGCNGPRGEGAVKDYWDLTLLHIYNYYIDGNYKGIEYMIGLKDNSKAKYYKEWLDSFGKKQNGWNNFVQKNYLGDDGDDKKNFVPKEGANYGKPRELWLGHFSNETSVLPESKEQCNEYFKNANKWILQRGILMVKELSSRINQLQIINKK